MSTSNFNRVNVERTLQANRVRTNEVISGEGSINNLEVDNLDVNNIEAYDVETTNLKATLVDSEYISNNIISSNEANIKLLNVESFIAENLDIYSISFTNFSASYLYVTTISATNITVSNLNFVSTSVDNFNANTITVNNSLTIGGNNQLIMEPKISIGSTNNGGNDQETGAIAIGQSTGVDNQRQNSIAIGNNAGNNNQGQNSISIGQSAGSLNQGIHSVSIGTNAGYTNQKEYSIAIGYQAGYDIQQSNAIAIGYQSGYTSQNSNTIAIGYQAGYSGQISNAIAIGYQTGYSGQKINAVAIGYSAGNSNQGTSSIAIGYQSGNINQGTNAIAIGNQAGLNTQRSDTIAIGSLSGKTGQGALSIAIGRSAGEFDQNTECVSIGFVAGQSAQAGQAVAVGSRAGRYSQNFGAVALGFRAGNVTQSTYAVSIGFEAGYSSQGSQSIAIGSFAAGTGQSSNSIAIGYQSAFNVQKENSIAIGYQAGYNNQYSNSIAIGYQAGITNQNQNSVAIGYQTGGTGQGVNSIAIGYQTGNSKQGTSSIAIGYQAGYLDQSGSAIAIGNQAGGTNQAFSSIAIGYQAGFTGHGTSSIAIGYQAGLTNPNNTSQTIILNSVSNTNLTATTSNAFYVKPIRNLSVSNMLFYNPTSGEITYNIPNIGTILPNGTQYSDYVFWNGSSWAVDGNKVHLGSFAGSSNQDTNSIAIGRNAGATRQLYNSIAIGDSAGNLSQSSASIAIGYQAGSNTQSQTAIAIGNQAGSIYQKPGTIAIGNQAGYSNQGSNAIAIGNQAGNLSQSSNAIAIGSFAGNASQSTYSIAIGSNAGEKSQQSNAIAIGYKAGSTTQQLNSIAIGFEAGLTNQGQYSIAIGNKAGSNTQPNNSIILNAASSILTGQTIANAFYVNPVRNSNTTSTLFYNPTTGEITYDAKTNIIPNAANYSDYIFWNNITSKWEVGNTTVHIGKNSGQLNQGANSISIGENSGNSSQSFRAVAIGYQAGQNNQSGGSIAIGYESGNANQGTSSIAIGYQAGQINQASNAISIGYQAGSTGQKINAVAIGDRVGYIDQGSYSIAIGNQIGFTTAQPSKTIILNANNSEINPTTSDAFYVKPIRNVSVSNILFYNPTSGEISYDYSTKAEIAIPNGTNYSDYLYWDSVTSSWKVDGSKIHLGTNSGFTGQGSNAIAIGNQAGSNTQASGGLAIGFQSGNTGQQQNSIAIGIESGKINQKSGAISIGYQAGFTSQNSNAIAIGNQAGYTNQDYNSIAIGSFAGNSSQSTYSIAIGSNAGEKSQQSNAIAIGYKAGSNTQQINSIAIGFEAGLTNQGQYSIAIGNKAGSNTQPNNSIILNAASSILTGQTNANAFYVNPVRSNATNDVLFYNTSTGEISRGAKTNIIPNATNYSDILYWDTVTSSWLVEGDEVHIGKNAGLTNQKSYAIAIGNQAGLRNQSESAIAIGYKAGSNTQGTSSIAIGVEAGFTNQGQYSIAIGNKAGSNTQPNNSIILNADSSILTGQTIANAFYVNPVRSNATNDVLFYNTSTGEISRGAKTNIIPNATNYGEYLYWDNTINFWTIGSDRISLGKDSGKTNQGVNTVAIGIESGNDGQRVNAVSIGNNAGNLSQGTAAIAIGVSAGSNTQGTRSIAIGSQAGFTNQGSFSIAIGSKAGQTNQPEKTIILNATDVSLNGTTANALYVNPIRNSDAPNFLMYDATNKEVVYTTNPNQALLNTTTPYNVNQEVYGQTYKKDTINVENSSYIKTSDIDAQLDNYTNNDQIYTFGKSQRNMWLIGQSGASPNNIKISYDGYNFNGSANQTLLNTSVNSIKYNGNIYVAGGQGTSNGIIYSYDAFNWSATTPASTDIILGLEYNDKIWVAVGGGTTNPIIKYSYDGVNWNSSNISNITKITDEIRKVKWNGKLFVAVGKRGQDLAWPIIYSYDGINWNDTPTSGDGFASEGIYDIHWNGSLFIVGGATGGNEGISWSLDGINWNTRLAVSIGTVRAVCSNGILTVAAGSTGIFAYSYTVTTGAYWTVGTTISGFQPREIKWNGTIFIAVGSNASNNNRYAISRDGISWVPYTLDNNTSCIEYTNDRLNYIKSPANLTVAAGSGDNLFAYSYNGINFTNTQYYMQSVNSVIFNNNKSHTSTSYPSMYVSIGSGTSNNLLISNNYTNWTKTNITATGIYNTVSYNNSGTYLLGISTTNTTRTILRSTDNAITWSEIATPRITSSTNKFAFTSDGQGVVAVGSGTTTIASSTNAGSTWGAITGTNSFTSVGYDVINVAGSSFIAVGNDNIKKTNDYTGGTWYNLTNTTEVMSYNQTGITSAYSTINNRWTCCSIDLSTTNSTSNKAMNTSTTSLSNWSNTTMPENGIDFVRVYQYPLDSNMYILGNRSSNPNYTSIFRSTDGGVNFSLLNPTYQLFFFIEGATFSTSGDIVIFYGRSTSTPGRVIATIPLTSLITGGVAFTYFSISNMNRIYDIAYGASFGRYVATVSHNSSNIGIYTSTNGSSSYNVGNSSVKLSTGYSVVYDGPTSDKIFVACGIPQTTSNITIQSSTNGIQWGEPIGTNIFTESYGVAFNPNIGSNGRWVAIGRGSNNTIAYSDDNASTWIGVSSLIFNSISSKNIYSISYGNNIFVATGRISNSDYAYQIAYSPDGITWNYVSREFFTLGYGNILSNIGNNILAHGFENYTSLRRKLLYSSDASNFTQLTANVSMSNILTINSSGTIFVMGGSDSENTIVYSTSSNASTWVGLGKTIFNHSCTNITWNGSRFIATGDGNKTAQSTDGIYWTLSPNIGVFSSQAKSVATDGYKWIAVGGNNESIAYSYDGKENWYDLPNSLQIVSNTNNITYINNKWFICASGTRNLIQSDNGIIWKDVSISTLTNTNNIEYNGSIYVAVGGDSSSNSTIAYSTNGINWTGLGKTIFTQRGINVKYNGNLFVAIGSGTNNLAYSYNGINWVGRNQSNLSNTTALAYNQSIWNVLASSTNNLGYSYDGINWSSTSTSSILANAGKDITWNGKMFVASDNRIGLTGISGNAYSYNGIEWTKVNNSSLGITGLNSNFNKTIVNIKHPIVAGLVVRTLDIGNLDTMAYSYDGINWNGIGVNTLMDNRVNSIAWNGDKWIAVGSGTNTPNSIIYSYDAINWTGLGNSLISNANTVLYGDKWLVGGTLNSPSSRVILNSTDGINWNYSNVGDVFTISVYNISWNGSIYVAGGQGTNALAYSNDGISWTGVANSLGNNSLTNNFQLNCLSVIYDGVKFIAGGDYGTSTNNSNTLAYSYDGISWTNIQQSKDLIRRVRTLAYNGSIYVAGGSQLESVNGKILYSYDGINWIGPPTDTADDIYGITWVGNKFVAVGGNANNTNNDKIYYSSNGINWYNTTVPANGTLLGNVRGSCIESNYSPQLNKYNSQLTINSNGPGQTNRLDISSGAYYDNTYTNFSVNIKTHKY